MSDLLYLDVPGISFFDMGRDIGLASSMKMSYASLNKGVDALLTTVLIRAVQLDVYDELMTELNASQSALVERMRRSTPFLAAAAQRYVPEMREIAQTFSGAGTTPAFHDGAAWLYGLLAQSELASETRADLPRERSLEDALEVFARALKQQK